MHEYKVITQSTAEALSARVTDMLNDGWMVVGGVSFTTISGAGTYLSVSEKFAQAMMKCAYTEVKL